MEATVQKILQEDPLLQHNFQQVRLGVNTPKQTFVPDTLYDTGSSRKVLSYHFDFSDNEFLHTARISPMDSKLLFAVPHSLQHIFREKWKQVSITHGITGLIDYIIREYAPEKESRVFVNVRQQEMTVILLEAGKIRFQNTYAYDSPEDFTYFILAVYQEFGLDPGEVKLSFMGELEKDAKIYQMVFQYVRNIDFMKRPSGFTYSYKLSFLPDHYFYSLFAIAG